MPRTKEPLTPEQILEELLRLPLESKLAIHIQLMLDIDSIQEEMKTKLNKIDETKTKMNGK